MHDEPTHAAEALAAPAGRRTALRLIAAAALLPALGTFGTDARCRKRRRDGVTVHCRRHQSSSSESNPGQPGQPGAPGDSVPGTPGQDGGNAN